MPHSSVETACGVARCVQFLLTKTRQQAMMDSTYSGDFTGSSTRTSAPSFVPPGSVSRPWYAVPSHLLPEAVSQHWCLQRGLWKPCRS
jgi:hypothetical protein